MIKDIDYLVLSDIHLGHRHTTTDEVLSHLYRYFDDFSKDSQYTDLDIIFIAGDLFDTLLYFSSKEIHDTTIWLYRLSNFCINYNIKLRVLEGTPSHDWKQSRIIETVDTLTGSVADIRYIDTLFIEHIDDLDIDVLYVPDEWSPTADETLSQVKELLSTLGKTSVDIAIMHGCFNYQVAHIPSNIDAHDESEYLDIVKHYINIGHYHVYSQYERIIAQGSFDRLSHGEERPKGATRMHIGENDSHFFIENKLAKIYKTITIRNKDIEKCLKTIANTVKHLPEGSYVRIKAKKDHPIYTAFTEVKTKFHQFVFSKITDESIVEKKKLSALDITNNTYTPITITSSNITQMVFDAVDTSDYNDICIEELHTCLEDIKNAL